MHQVDDKTPSTDAEDEKPTAYAWYVAVILMLVYTLSFIDRKLPFILVQAIKKDLNLSDTQIGLLTGIMFALVYSTIAIPLGALADRRSRKRLIAGSIVVWSALTAAGGLAQNFVQLAGARVGLAIGEAGFTPSAHSMIADYFSPKYRARAMGLYFVGAQLGILLGLALGGWIADLASWRMAMFLCGIPGIFFSILILLTIREPARKLHGAEVTGAAAERPAISETFKVIFGQPTIVHLFVAGILFTFTTGAVNAFGPAYIMRTYHLTTAQTGLTYGLLSGAAGTFGALLGGYVGDRLRKVDTSKSLLFVACAMLLAAPFLALALFVHSYPLFLILIFVPQAAAMTYAGPSFSTLQSLISPRMHGMASAIFLFALSGLGAALGPLVAGMISDALKRAEVPDTLRWSLIILTFPMVWAAGHYLLAARALKRKQVQVAADAAAAG